MTHVLKIIVAIVAACCGISALVGALLFWMADPLNIRAPSDQELMTTFHNHRKEFEQLRRMVTEDKVSYLTESSFGNQLNAARGQEYKKTISTIHSGIILTSDYEVVRFIFAIGGLSAISPGWLKGITYVSGDPKGSLAQNLDNARKLPANVYLRMIEPNWYILYQRTDD